MFQSLLSLCQPTSFNIHQSKQNFWQRLPSDSYSYSRLSVHKDSKAADLSNIVGSFRRVVQNALKFSRIRKIIGIGSVIAVSSNGFPAVCHSSDHIFSEVAGIVRDNYFDSTYNSHDISQLEGYYRKKLSEGADENKAIKDFMLQLGDKYTRLLDKSYFESLWKYDAIGIGVLFQTDAGKPMIVASQPIKGSSSASVGMKKDDIVYAINGVSTKAMTAIDLLDKMSNDESRIVEIEFGDPNRPNERRIEKLARSTQQATNPVTFSISDMASGKKVGYIKLKEFNAKAVTGMEEALKSFKDSRIDEVVLDLRSNTGGGFQFALNIGGMFLDNKDMVVTAGKNNEKMVFKSSYPPGVLYDGHLVILTDALSASASEVLAGGLRDNCKAVLAGETSFGKGKIQAVFGLSNGAGMTMTVAQYVTPKGTVIQSKGLTPDLPIQLNNAYLQLLAGDILPNLGLEKIDFNEADAIADMCSAGQQ